MWFLLCIVLTSVTVLYLFITNYQKKRHFESKGIHYLGNGTIRMVVNMFKGKSFVQDFFDTYNVTNLQENKLSGSVDFGQTTLIINDPEIVKAVLVKDFEHFTDRRVFRTGKLDYLFGKMLITKTGERWKALRSKLSPTFTTGKIKRMFAQFDTSGKKFVKFLESEIGGSSGEIELSEGYSKFTMDIIASAACGIDSQAFNQKEPSVFEQMGKKLQFQFGGFALFKFIAIALFPTKLSDALGLSFFDQNMQEFFSKAIKSSIQERQVKGYKRDDFVQLMLEARAGSLKTDENELDTFEKDAIVKSTGARKEDVEDMLDDDGIVANAVLFILAGFDTTQSLLLFCAYALALNQEIQDKLRCEIDRILEENDGEFSYDGLNKMTYLDMVINETLRIYPPAVGTDRGCTADFKVPGTDFVLKKGDAVVVPIYGFHHDPEIFSEPEKFIPERFLPENKHKINPYTFLPFGQGPRNCIGMRFALTEAKVVISYLVHSFKIEPSAKTMIPMKFSATSSLKPEGGMYLSLTKIH